MNLTRRLPVYLLLDCSESMAGPGLAAVNAGVGHMVAELKSNPYALETAFLSVITFHREVRQLAPLTEVMKFQIPNLTVRAGSSLGGALKLLLKCLQTEVVRTSATAKGDYKPLVFLLTDGQPTDDWEAAAAALKKANNPKIANLYAIGCGPDVDYDMLREVTDIVLKMNDLTPEAFKRFFVWLSASINTASLRLEGGTSTSFDMPPLPRGVEIAPESTTYRTQDPRQVFLQAMCRKTRKAYLIRYALRANDDRYEAIAAHEIDLYEKDGGDFMPSINSSRLEGIPDCPYCSNPGAAVCECGVISCIGESDIKKPVKCPACGLVGDYGTGGGSFDVRQSGG